MENTARISDRFTVCKVAPDPDTLRSFAEEGFRTIVNMRTDGEEQDLTPAQEGRVVNDAGLSYLHYPVSGDSFSDHVVDGFREKARGLPAPILVHCGSGKRSGLLVMMHVASEEGMSGEDAVREAQKLGLPLGTPELKETVRDYVERHNGK